MSRWNYRGRHNRKRRAYTGSKIFSESCRSHGSCPWCAAKYRYKLHKKIRDDQREDAESMRNARIKLWEIENKEDLLC